MPEGDTIHRTAATLRRALRGALVRAARSNVPALALEALVGTTVEEVEARGKNLLVRFSQDRVLYTHLRMTGSWHVYRSGERWRRPERQARVVLETESAVAVCFNAPTVELLTARQLERHPLLARLGPDLAAARCDVEAGVRRLAALGSLEIGEALLAQGAVAGIGNVYKSETLFLCRVDPFRRVGALEEETLTALVREARRLLRANLGGGPRRTRASPRAGQHRAGRLWVYGRRGRPCFRCGAVVRTRRQGLAARSTYWCPVCQGART